LFLSYKHYQEEQKELKEKVLKIFFYRREISLKKIFDKKNYQIVIDYLEKTKIAIRNGY